MVRAKVPHISGLSHRCVSRNVPHCSAMVALIMKTRAHPQFLYEKAHWRKVTRKQVLLNAGYRCARCNADLHNSRYQAHVHHIIPTSHVPELIHDIFNLEALCMYCHNREHGRGSHGCAVDGTPLDPNHPWNKTDLSH
jgi:5-methylcytosine-specific restriction endonuclease McrA